MAISKNRDITVPLVEVFLIQRNVFQHLIVITASQPPNDGALHQIVHLNGGKAQKLGGLGLHSRGGKHSNGKTFEGEREAGIGLGPGRAHRFDAVLGTFYAGNAGHEQCLEVAAIEVTPSAFLAQIVTEGRRAALRTGKLTQGGIMFHEDMNFLRGNV